jgi:ankyrin repeat protein
MAYNFPKCLFFLLFFTTNLFGSIEDQLVDLKYKLTELKNNLELTQPKTGYSSLDVMPDEILEKFFLNLIPDSIDSSQELIETFKTLNRFAVTNKRTLAWFKADIEFIRRKLLGSINSKEVIYDALDELKEIKIPELKEIVDNLSAFDLRDTKLALSETYIHNRVVSQERSKSWESAASELLDQGLNPIIFVDPVEISKMLVILAYFGMPAVAFKLLEEGFDPKVFINNVEFLYYTAQRKSNYEVADKLLQEGLNPNAHARRSLLYTALSNYNYNLAIKLLKKGAKFTEKADYNDPSKKYSISVKPADFLDRSNKLLQQLIEVAIEKGLDPNDPFNEFGLGNPLMYAVYIDNKEFIKFLLDHGANPNNAVAYGSSESITPLQFAQDEGKEEIVELLRTYKKE